ncbi:hypothetical protein I3843_06G103700 [Carya illinoinensis]|uniref:Cytochrome b-c1 complex subunit Rieske transmembrane domain-containing protein n=1 Tax=Carya illinoinensis TaxID=32201 RepID=A0A922ERT4_CARIL|nr:hypothetical protein I3842_06G109800 [Carya illinoinensis]KAG7975530.1 hypothetical protein I3843_06G103700 [Carya illinoinensis]
MLRVAGRRLSSMVSRAIPVLPSRHLLINNPDSGTSSDGSSSHSGSPKVFPLTVGFIFPGFSSEALIPRHDVGKILELPPTKAAAKNPTPKIVYDEHNHECYPPGEPSKRAFAYLVLTGGRFVYASLIMMLIIKFILSMSASKDVLALASHEVDLSGIEPGTTVSVKWRGKPVFVKHRTEEDIKLANAVDVRSLRHPQEEWERVKKPEWLVVVGGLYSSGLHSLAECW